MIIAVDFDGILARDDVPFPGIGTPNFQIINLIDHLVLDGHEVVLWTSRTGPALSDALTWCHRYGLEFCAVNDNTPSNKIQYGRMYPQGTRKVCADIYIDDHNPDFILDLKNHGYFVAIDNIVKKVKEIEKLWKKEN